MRCERRLHLGVVVRPVVVEDQVQPESGGIRLIETFENTQELLMAMLPARSTAR